MIQWKRSHVDSAASNGGRCINSQRINQEQQCAVAITYCIRRELIRGIIIAIFLPKRLKMTWQLFEFRYQNATEIETCVRCTQQGNFLSRRLWHPCSLCPLPLDSCNLIQSNMHLRVHTNGSGFAFLDELQLRSALRLLLQCSPLIRAMDERSLEL